MQNFSIKDSIKDYTNRWISVSLPSAFLGGAMVIGGACNTITKVVGSALALFSPSGKNQLNDFANNGFSSIVLFDGSAILPGLFMMTVRLINPYSKVKKIHKDHSRGMIGPLTRVIAHPFFKKGFEEADSPANPNIRKHVVSRASFLCGTALLALTKTVEIGIGLFLGGVALVLLGSSSKVNYVAVRFLTSSDMLEDICAGVRCIFNPWTDIGQLGEAWAGKENWDFREVMWKLA